MTLSRFKRLTIYLVYLFYGLRGPRNLDRNEDVEPCEIWLKISLIFSIFTPRLTDVCQPGEGADYSQRHELESNSLAEDSVELEASP